MNSKDVDKLVKAINNVAEAIIHMGFIIFLAILLNGC
jgi:hypothetical protein